ncbi:MAG: hypothetical protein V1756_00115 [Patescibacteria group bacterium]
MEVNMEGTFYHGSGNLFPKIERRHPTNYGIPRQDRRNAIYITSDYITALAFAAMPEGKNAVGQWNGKRTVHFENPDLFDPDKEVYVYFVDISEIPGDKVFPGDEGEIVVDVDEITPVRIEKHKAGEVSQYYSIIKGENK